MTVLLAHSGRTLLSQWPGKQPSIAAGRVVRLLRVATIHISTRSPSQSPVAQLNDFSLLPTRRSFATRPGRPKGHTGRAAASKTPKKTTTSKTPQPNATKTTAKPKAKPKPKKKLAKSKPKKPAGRSRRPLTEAGKLRLEKRKQLDKVKDLKAAALSPPKRLPDNAWTVYVSEQAKTAKTQKPIDKSMSDDYKNFTPEQKEHYNHIANQNKAANHAAYSKWIESYTPDQVNQANNARKQLKKQLSQPGKYTPLKDDRIVKQPRTAYIYYLQERIASGDLKHMKVSEVGSLLGSEWKGLTEDEKKKYKDSQAADILRYEVEYKTVYGKDPESVKRQSKAKST